MAADVDQLFDVLVMQYLQEIVQTSVAVSDGKECALRRLGVGCLDHV